MKTALVVLSAAAVAFAQDKILSFQAKFAQADTVSASMPNAYANYGVTKDESLFRPYLALHDNHMAIKEAHSKRFTARQGGFGFSTTTTGKISYDYPNSRQRLDVTSIGFEISTGMTPIPMPSGAPPIPGGGGMGASPIPLTGDNFMIYRYDIGKNFTKIEGYTNGCECKDLSGEIDTYYVPPGSNNLGPDTLTINGAKVATTKYGITLAGGSGSGAGSFNIALTIWIESVSATRQDIRRIVVDLKAGDNSMGGVTTSTTISFWDVQPSVANAKEVFTPSDCYLSSCPNAIVIPPAPAAAKTAVCGQVAAPQGCKCYTTAEATANFPYCAPFVNYPVDPAVDTPSMDSFVKLAVSAADPNNGCADLKKFMCEFYFMRCWDGKETYRPTTPPTCEAFLGTQANLAYDTGIAEKGPSSSSGAGAFIASIIALAAASIAVLAF